MGIVTHFPRTTWLHLSRLTSLSKMDGPNLVDFDPLDHDQMHVIKFVALISLVRSNNCNLISHLTNDDVTCSDLWTLR